MYLNVSNILTSLYFLSLLLMVIFTNVKPYLSQERSEIRTIHHSMELELEEELMIWVVINQIIIMIIGKAF